MSRNVEELVRAHLPLVQAVAARAFPAWREDQDLLQCGRIGLWRAAVGWDGQRRFAPYACTSIHNSMNRWLRTQAGQDVPLPDGCDGAAPHGEDELLEDLYLRQRIESAWPRGTPEHYILTCLAEGVPKDRLAASLGCSTWDLTRRARRAWLRVPL